MNPVALTVLKSKWTWITVAVLIIIIVVHANWDNLTGWTRRTYGDFGQPSITPQRKGELENMARVTFAEIDGASYSSDFIAQLLALNDLELKYVGEHYNNAITRGTKLSDDIDNEWISGDDDATLVARLRAMNL